MKSLPQPPKRPEFVDLAVPFQMARDILTRLEAHLTEEGCRTMMADIIQNLRLMEMNQRQFNERVMRNYKLNLKAFESEFKRLN